MSLTRLFLLMGSVSLLMMGAIVYNKIGGASYVTVSEVRSIDRLCQRDVEKMLETFAKEAKGDERTYMSLFKSCLNECRTYLADSRLKKIQNQKVEVKKPQCLAKEKLPKEYHDYYFKHLEPKESKQ
jgi:hypothetical protein